MFQFMHCHLDTFFPVTQDIYGKQRLMQEYDQLDEVYNPVLMRRLLRIKGLTIMLIGGFMLREESADIRL